MPQFQLDCEWRKIERYSKSADAAARGAAREAQSQEVQQVRYRGGRCSKRDFFASTVPHRETRQECWRGSKRHSHKGRSERVAAARGAAIAIRLRVARHRGLQRECWRGTKKRSGRGALAWGTESAVPQREVQQERLGCECGAVREEMQQECRRGSKRRHSHMGRSERRSSERCRNLSSTASGARWSDAARMLTRQQEAHQRERHSRTRCS